jgi:cell division protein ZapA
MKTLIEVEIFGQTFTVTSEDEAKYVQELAAFVDQRIKRIGESTKATVPLRVAIMAALSIADEHLKARKQESEEAEIAERISARLLTRLDQSEKTERAMSDKVPDPPKTHYVSLRANQE